MAFRPGIHSSGMPTVTGSIPQDNIIFGMVLLAFVIYITVKNELQTYMGFFSPSKSTSAPAKLPKIRISDTRAPLVEGEHEIYGLMQSIRGDNMTVRLRNGDLLTIDASLADELLQRATSSVGHAVLARGTFDGAGVLHANTILRAKDNSALWWPDR